MNHPETAITLFLSITFIILFRKASRKNRHRNYYFIVGLVLFLCSLLLYKNSDTKKDRLEPKPTMEDYLYKVR